MHRQFRLTWYLLTGAGVQRRLPFVEQRALDQAFAEIFEGVGGNGCWGRLSQENDQFPLGGEEIDLFQFERKLVLKLLIDGEMEEEKQSRNWGGTRV